MVVARIAFALLMVGAVLSFAMYIGTGQVLWRRRGLTVLKWTLLVSFAFFAALILERLALLL